MNVALELIDLQCIRGGRVLFEGVSACVQAGRMLRVHGRNGAGKTSLLRIASGLSSPSKGRVLWQGAPVQRQRDAGRLHLVYLGHAPALKEELTSLENLQSGIGLAGLSCTQAQATAALARAGLQGREHLPARVLSQGQRKRASLARLALEPTASSWAPLWILDEPFDALDDAAATWLQRTICNHLARGGVVVLTGHQVGAWEASLPQSKVSLRIPQSAAMATLT